MRDVVQDAALWPLAQWIASVPREADQRLRERLFATTLDWSTALVAGLGHPLLPTYRDALSRRGETGPHRVAGEGQTHPLATAATLNAAIGHFWEVDDAHRDSTSHPGITVIPGLIALAEIMPDRRPHLGAAIVAGFEAILRIGSYLGAGHYAVNHTTATAGTLGAAAGAARFLGLDAKRTLWTLGHAGTQAAGLWQFLDDGATRAKAFHASIAARNGLAAAQLAQAGIEAATHILEGPRGMLASWRLAGGDPAWLQPDGDPMIHSVTIKGWPTCGQTHSALDAARHLAEMLGDDAAAAQSVTVDLPQAALDIASIADPQNVAEAKFSTAFCIAAALRGTPPDFRGLTPELVADPAIRDLARRVELRADPAFNARFPKERPARVTVTLPDGRNRSEERAFRGGDPEAPWSEAQLLQRSRDVLSLAPVALDPQPLIDWSRALSEGDPDWTPLTLFDFARRAAGQG